MSEEDLDRAIDRAVHEVMNVDTDGTFRAGGAGLDRPEPELRRDEERRGDERRPRVDRPRPEAELHRVGRACGSDRPRDEPRPGPEEPQDGQRNAGCSDRDDELRQARGVGRGVGDDTRS